VIVTRNRVAEEGDLDEFLEELATMKPPVYRVPGTAIFLNASAETTPLAMRSLVEHTHALAERVLIVSVFNRNVPNVIRSRRFKVKRMGRGRCQVLHVIVNNGYRDTNSVPELLQLARKLGHLERNLDLEGASYFISRMTITEARTREMASWRKKLFLVIARNAASPIEHFGLPIERTVLMGSQVSL
jgi:KUP system potassium uptake protein